MAPCACEGREESCSGVRWRNPTARATTTYPQKFEHRRPALVRNVSVAGRQQQPLALPRGVPNAGGGLVAEVQRGELGVVQDAGDEVASGSDRDFVIIL